MPEAKLSAAELEGLAIDDVPFAGGMGIKVLKVGIDQVGVSIPRMAN